ncbi:ABC transporter ATP-binding protein [Microvirga puerhi]|uniref:Glutathione import ATP-binding protein GsiA n=1 Tax=Microvirga puerhi TaxID=2876078 RepID=A0ABS7VJQ2_9HYPH|nr:oligopeptide/dipeptide ABC transporter ATP-binding protein [Microvirga puerhi]MBZ6075756.1 ATP-binding cassette domain-containing protein [Microvirga puerhi]
MNTPAIQLKNVSVRFPIRTGILRRVVGEVHAVDDISFEINEGETLGLVGESGSGKSTTGRALMGLAPLTAGSVACFGRDLKQLKLASGALPRISQIVFQDPYASLNPRMTIGETLQEVLEVHGLAKGRDAKQRVDMLLDDVGLRRDLAERHPHALSGGQRQRVAIARALAIEPKFIVLDEVVSALDVSIQGQIVNLLQDLQRDRKLTYLFITHDLSIVRHVSHSLVVMYGGQVMEKGPRKSIFAAPLHPYTSALLSAVPVPDPKIERMRPRIDVRSEPPNPLAPLTGCRFQKSCLFASEICRSERPQLQSIEGHDPQHLAACHHMREPRVREALSRAARGALS